MKTNQCTAILDYIDEFGSITPLEAMRDLGVMRLAARIHDIGRMGIRIDREIVADRNRRGEPIHYARYKKVN